MRQIKYSFEQCCIDNNRKDILKYWQVDLNGVTPDKVSYRSNKKYWFWCGNPEHSPRQISVDNLSKTIINGKDYLLCIGCNSIGQYIIDNYGREYLKNIWSDKNELEPFDILRGSKTKIYLRCLKNVEHEDYSVACNCFHRTHNCPYCSGRRASKTNNALMMYPELKELWSEKNEKQPEDYTYGSSTNVWLKCANHKHPDFQRQISNFKQSGTTCPRCIEESIIRYEDLTGQRFGKLIVTGLDREGSGKCGIRWFCDCDCGTKHKSILASHLKSGKIISCGCVWLRLSERERANIGKKSKYTNSENHKIRNSTEYAKWRREVLKLNDNKCVICGSDHRNEIHHIYPFLSYPEKRFDVSNGIDLCFIHHNMFVEGSFHNVYGTDTTPEQLEEYINNKRLELGITKHFDIYEYMNNIKVGLKGENKMESETTNKVKWNDEFFTDDELNSYFDNNIKEPLVSYIYRLRNKSDSNKDESVEINNRHNIKQKVQHMLPRYRVCKV